jgi:hypothetical protein
MLLSFVSVVVFASIVACSENAGQPCYPGDLRACTCADGSSGMQQCAPPDAATNDYGACNCAPVPDAAPSDAAQAEGGDGGLLGFLANCTTNAECQSMNCFAFVAKGPHCTKSCTVDTDCPPPSPGCSGMMVCKAP